MRASMAFFAGAGTILAAIAVGVGGGYTVANIISPHPQKQDTSRLERRTSPEAVFAASDQPTAHQPPVPYVGSTVAASTLANTVQNQSTSQSTAGKGAQQPALAETAAADRDRKAAAQPSQPHAQPSQPQKSERAATVEAGKPDPVKPEQRASAPEDANANATARDGDLKRFSDRRKVDRRQWSDRQQSDDRGQWGDSQQSGDRQWPDRRFSRERDWRDNQQDAWNDSSRRDRDTRDRDARVRNYRNYDRGDYAERQADQPIRMFDSPRFRIFGSDD